MNILTRLKLELNNKEYFTDENYKTLLLENGLTDTDEYIKATHQRDLLYSCIDVLEIMANDLNNFMKIETDFSTTGECLKSIESRIEKIKQRIYSISDVEADSNITLLYRKS